MDSPPVGCQIDLTPMVAWIALALIGLTSGICPEDRWITLVKHADELRMRGQYSEALPVYSSALEAAQKFGPGELPVGFVFNNMAFDWQQMGQFREAIRWYAQALAIFERRYPPGDHHTIEVATNLSNAYLTVGDVSRSEALLRHFLDGEAGLRPKDKGALLEDLGTVLLKQGDIEGAERNLADALALFEDGQDQERVVIALGNLSAASAQSGDLAAAWRYSERARTIAGRLPEVSLSVVIKALTNSAVLAARMGRVSEADELFQEVIPRCQKNFGPDHYILGYLLESYGRFLQQTKRKKQGQEVEKRAQSILSRFMTTNRMGLTVDSKVLEHSSLKP